MHSDEYSVSILCQFYCCLSSSNKLVGICLSIIGAVELWTTGSNRSDILSWSTMHQ